MIILCCVVILVLLVVIIEDNKGTPLRLGKYDCAIVVKGDGTVDALLAKEGPEDVREIVAQIAVIITKRIGGVV